MKNHTAIQLTLLLMLATLSDQAWAQKKIFRKKIYGKSTYSVTELSQKFPALPDRYRSDPEQELSQCVTVRGNGGKAFSTFHSLARLMEHYGPFNLIHGSSSGSVVAFIYESVMINRAIRKCGERQCSKIEEGQRASLALKSITGYLQHLKSTPDADAVTGMQNTIQRLKDNSLLESVVTAQHAVAGYRLLKILNTDLGNLLNPEIADGLLNPFQTRQTFSWVKQWLAGAGKWQTDSQDFLFLPSLLSFSNGVDLLNRMANFYAAYNPMDPELWEHFFAACSDKSVTLLWPDIAGLALQDPLTQDTTTCGQYFTDIMLEPYRARMLYQEARLRELKEGRIFDGVGEKFPAVVSSSIGQGQTYISYLTAQKNFRADKDYEFYPEQNDIKAGYWGQAARVQRIVDNPLQYPDYKSRNSVYLGAATWKRAVSHSAAEPGLSPILDYADELPGTFTSGGWFDNHGSLALRNMGCKKIVYVTRAGLDSDFAQGVYRQLGADDERIQGIFDLRQPMSSMSLTLKESDLIWCTQWDRYEPTDAASLKLLIADGYQAMAISQDPYFTAVTGAYPLIQSQTEEIGCQKSSR